eukprot:8772061-Lingulodinium_polyedra.AAC.1
MNAQRLVACFAVLAVAASQPYVGFDSAVASSIYSLGDFAADKATALSSGYWCRCCRAASKLGAARCWNGCCDPARATTKQAKS